MMRNKAMHGLMGLMVMVLCGILRPLPMAHGQEASKVKDATLAKWQYFVGAGPQWQALGYSFSVEPVHPFVAVYEGPQLCAQAGVARHLKGPWWVAGNLSMANYEATAFIEVPVDEPIFRYASSERAALGFIKPIVTAQLGLLWEYPATGRWKLFWHPQVGYGRLPEVANYREVDTALDPAVTFGVLGRGEAEHHYLARNVWVLESAQGLAYHLNAQNGLRLQLLGRYSLQPLQEVAITNLFIGEANGSTYQTTGVVRNAGHFWGLQLAFVHFW